MGRGEMVACWEAMGARRVRQGLQARPARAAVGRVAV